jgi:hypothetical protein
LYEVSALSFAEDPLEGIACVGGKQVPHRAFGVVRNDKGIAFGEVRNDKTNAFGVVRNDKDVAG